MKPQSMPQKTYPNPYTCRLLMRIDGLLYRLRGNKVEWRGGHVCIAYPSGSAVAVSTHFPDWMFRAAAFLQNRWPWTRRVLSL